MCRSWRVCAMHGSQACNMPLKDGGSQMCMQDLARLTYRISSCDMVGCAPLSAAWKAPIAELEGAKIVTALPLAVSVGICALTLPAQA